MDELYEVNGITFVWDPEKAKINLENHGITFKQSAEAFFDPFLRR